MVTTKHYRFPSWKVYACTVLSFLPLSFTPLISVAQTRPQPAGTQLTGTVIDGQTKQPIHAATVALLRKDSSVAAEVISKADGEFAVKGLSESSALLRISVVGYQTVTKLIPAGHRTPGVPFNIGTLKLSPAAAQMQAVAVVARRPVFKTEIDKKVFNVDQSLASKGGTAQDALRQVPTLNVDATGNVTLRNGSPTILLDGKQTQLTLDQIPADQIQSIEVMPNPSAKYDAQGNHGLINIVLKRNRKPGMNGSFTGVGSTLGETYGFANLNVYKHKWNFTFNAMAHGHRSVSNTTTTLNNFAANTTSIQRGHSVTIGPFQSYRLGADYNMNAHNTFSLAGNVGFGYHPSGGTQITDYASKGELDSTGTRQSYDANHFVFTHSNFDWAHTFTKSGEKWTASAAMETYHGRGHGNYNTQFFDKGSTALGAPFLQRYSGLGNGHNLTMQTDYTDPLLDGKAKLEAGVKTILHGSRSYQDFENDSAQGFKKYASASYNYRYDDNTYAAYTSFNQELGKFSYMAGLRFERYNYTGHLLDEGTSFGYHQTGLYPSIYLTEKFDEDNDLHLNFSRRVNRPQWWQITPQTNFGNPLNPQRGNPEIRPENTNLAEIAYNTQVSGIGLNTTVYFKNTLDPIMAYNTPPSHDTILSTYENGNYSNTLGAEIIARIPIAKWWNATTNFNVYQTDINADNLSQAQGQGLSNSGVSWFAKLNSDMKLFNMYSLQLTGNYNAGRVIAQGKVLPSGGLDAAVKREFLPHNAATLVLSLSDIFNTQRSDVETFSSGQFFQNSYNKPETRVLKVSFMYSFGKDLSGDRHKGTLDGNG